MKGWMNEENGLYSLRNTFAIEHYLTFKKERIPVICDNTAEHRGHCS